MANRSILLAVDLQKDFIDGSLTVPGAHLVIPEINRVKSDFDLVYFTLDWHPVNHCSFKEQGGPWPPHCVQGTHGADVHEALLPYVKDDMTFFKGENQAQEQYSGFEGVNPAGQSLGEVLHLLDVQRVLVCGIATEYCVRNTAEDLLKDGFEVSVLKDALAWVDADGHVAALKAMEEEGIRIL
jgi:nicotinamidase-related amidase